MGLSVASLPLRLKLIALGTGSVILTASVLVGVGAWQSGRFADQAAENVAAVGRADLTHVADGTARLVDAAGTSVQDSVNRAMTVARAELSQRGGLRFDGDPTNWRAVDQVSDRTSAVRLPGANVGGQALGQNRDVRRATPLVDDVARMVGATVTVFQRMNASGDLLRVATTVKSKTGQRAIGTYIPATGADGKPNAVAAAIRSGESYRGVAQVVGNWYITAYDPIRDRSGNVVGAIYVGVPQEAALAALTATIAETTVGANGWVSVVSTAPADQGRVIASSRDGLVGETILDERDAAGTPYVEQIVARAPELTDGTAWNTGFTLPGAAGAPAAPTSVDVRYYAPYQWALVVAGYGPDSAAAVEVVQRGRTTMLTAFALAALLLTVAGGAIAWAMARRISTRLRRLSGTLDRLAERDLTVTVVADGDDEIGKMGGALARAVGQLRELVTDITAAAAAVAGTAGHIGEVSGELADSAARSSAQTGSATTAADEVRRDVRTVSAGAEELGVSINEISGNAQEAAHISADSVALARDAGSVIARLGESSAKIADVVRMINGIAAQTNLLALNATIEAARAGAAGAGFAVVASEVKDLARETGQATGEVSARVTAIAEDTERAIRAIDGTATAIERVNDYQAAIAAAVEEQSATTGEMGRGVRHAADGADQIAENLAAAALTVQATRDAARQSEQAASELDATARQLTELVNRFAL